MAEINWSSENADRVNLHKWVRNIGNLEEFVIENKYGK
jgi:hypothetical protein